jgi:TRAP-type C4-dicarboxylate transport system permease small subunit
MAWPRRLTLVWTGLSLGVLLLIGLVMLPPWLPPTARYVLMEAFAPLCHQLPARSPTIGGVHLAVCDRCIGIYVGFAGGIVLAAVVRALALALALRRLLPETRTASWSTLHYGLRYVLAGALLPLAIDWTGPLLAQWTPLTGWTNTPLSRALTGGLLGAAAGLLLIVSIARNMTRSTTDTSNTSTAEPASPSAAQQQ